MVIYNLCSIQKGERDLRKKGWNDIRTWCDDEQHEILQGDTKARSNRKINERKTKRKRQTDRQTYRGKE